MIHGGSADFFNATDYFVDRNIREGRGHKVAIYSEYRNYTYNDMEKMTNKTANAFRELGVRVDDRVVILMLDVPQFYAVFWGAIKIGAVPIPVNTMLTPEEYEYYLNDSRARVLVVSEQLIANVMKIQGDLRYVRDLIVISEKTGAHIPFKQKYRHASETIKTEYTTREDVGFWIYSPGSEGAPKGAIHSQNDMVVAAETYAKGILGLTEDDIVFSASRLFFAYGLGNSCYFPLFVGASSVLNPGTPNPENVVRHLEKFRPTVFFGVPTLYGQILGHMEKLDKEKGITPDPNADHAFSSVRLCISSGEPLPSDIYTRWKKRFGIDILDGIGSTEMLHIFMSNRPGDIRPGSAGKPVPGYEVRIVNEKGKDVPRGDIGTLLVKGGSSSQQYWRRRSDQSQLNVQGEWVNTGDRFYEDSDGYYWSAGRGDHMMKVGGIWISPLEIENCLAKHAAVQEVAVQSFMDDRAMAKPKAFVVLKEGYEPSPELEEELKKWATDRLARYKYPRWIEFVKKLPKSSTTGKVHRFKLR